MIDRRTLLIGATALLLAPGTALAQQKKKKKQPFRLDPIYEPQLVDFPYDHPIGSVVVDPANRFLYLVETAGVARRYGVGVGRQGATFRGTAVVGRKAKWPWWRPTDNMIKRNPAKYARYANGLKGGPGNPLGSRAIYLYRNGRDTLYRIHGTTEPSSIGRAVSNGCIRMLNAHVEDLYERVPVGATVVVLG